MLPFSLSGVLSLILMLFMPGVPLCAGFALYNHSTAAVAQGAAVIAHSDDASALFYNPALMSSLDTSQVKTGTYILQNSVKFRSAATGRRSDMEKTTHVIPALSAVYRINDRVSAGLGIFSHFGLSTTWDDDWEGRYLATESELKTYTVNPALSFRAAPGVSIAGGIDMVILEAELNRNVNLSPFMLPDIRQKLSGDDRALAYNLGLLVDLNGSLSFGASYRSKIKGDFEGDIEHEIPAVVPAALASQFPDTSASTSVNLPPQAFIGLAYSGISRFVFEVSLKWEGWSEYEELRISLDQPVLGMSENVTPKKWKDVYPLSLGAQFRASDRVNLYAGYIYDPSPVPEDTFEPSVPDSDGHVFSLGSDFAFGNFNLGLLYSFKKYNDREKNNALDDNPLDGVFNPLTSANGTYKSSVHLVGMDISWAF